jgi:hypothetical protein
MNFSDIEKKDFVTSFIAAKMAESNKMTPKKAMVMANAAWRKITIEVVKEYRLEESRATGW